MNILHRMLLKELLKVFVLALVSLTGLFLVAGLVQEASQRGLSPGQILAAIPLLIPNALPFTIPTTTLFATCVVYGRLAHDNEYLAIKSAGVYPLKILRPAMLLGLVAGGTTIGLYYYTIPRTHQIMKERILRDGEAVLYNILKRERRLHFRDSPYVMYVREVKGRRLIDMIFKRKHILPNGYHFGYDLVARAREARLRIDRDAKLGYVDMDRCVVTGDQKQNGRLLNQTIDFPLPAELSGREETPRPMTMTWQELLRERKDLIGQTEALQQKHQDASADLTRSSPGPGQEMLKLHVQNLDNKLHAVERRDLNLANELQMRPALAFGCLCFVLVGCPIGIWFSRSDYLSAFVSCFLPIIFFYYPLLLCGSNLGREGKLPVVPAVWTANGLMVLIAVYLLRRLVRR